MKQTSYTKNYLKIYIAQFLAILINVLSLVIVIPFISGNAQVYGIYTLCISFTIFLSYADLGFLNAGYKYASEYYVKGELQKEIEIVGFVSFILLVFVLIFSACIATLAFHPTWLIKNISNSVDIYIAKSLLLILSLSSPYVVLQRMLQIIYGIRVEDYILQIILMIVNILKISSVYFFISKNQYNIVGCFFFCQLTTCVGLTLGILFACKKYNISLNHLLANIRFSKNTFKSIKHLAYGSLYITIGWILFYELDPYVIAKLSGAEAVAFYSIGLTCLAFFRSIFGALFGPFSARFNHFVALNDNEGLINFSKLVICVLLPAVVFPTITLSLLSKPIVLTWVGDKFYPSIKIVTLLSLCNIFAFISYPGGILSVATKKIRLLYFISTLQIIIYWFGIAIFFSHYGYYVFAYFELCCFIVSGITYTWFICTFMHKTIFGFVKEIIVPVVLPVILLIAILIFVRGVLPVEKDKMNLLKVVLAGILASSAATVLYYVTSKVFRNYINNLIFKTKLSFINRL